MDISDALPSPPPHKYYDATEEAADSQYPNNGYDDAMPKLKFVIVLWQSHGCQIAIHLQ